MPEEINHHRRRFLGAAALSVAAAQLSLIGSAKAQPNDVKPADLAPVTPDANTSFGPLKQIDAGVLNVGYAEAGPADGPAVILLHGWPYDIYSFVDVAPLLATAGYRVIVPYLRGYGTTRFLSGGTIRNGQQSVVAVDILALMDAFKIRKAILGGFDWGARTVDIIAALWPERCKGLVSVSGYLIGSQEAGKTPLPPKAELQWWYQYYFATERGRRNGISRMPPSIAAPRPSTTRITSRSSFTITAGGLVWRKARRNMTIWKSAWRKVRSSPCPPSPWKGMPMELPTRIPVPMPRNSPASTHNGPLPAASDTICRKKRRKPLRKPLLMLTLTERAFHKTHFHFGIRGGNGSVRLRFAATRRRSCGLHCLMRHQL